MRLDYENLTTLPATLLSPLLAVMEAKCHVAVSCPVHSQHRKEMREAPSQQPEKK